METLCSNKVFGKREVRVRSASVVPKSNNGLMTLCYIWVRSASVVPTRNNGLMTHCYIWVQWASAVPFGYEWFRSYPNFIYIRYLLFGVNILKVHQSKHISLSKCLKYMQYALHLQIKSLSLEVNRKCAHIYTCAQFHFLNTMILIIDMYFFKVLAFFQLIKG